MRRKLLTLCTMFTVLAMLPMASPATISPAVPAAKSVESLSMFQATKFDAHYRVPRDETIEQILLSEGIVKPGPHTAQAQVAVQQFRPNSPSAIRAHPIPAS
jgi:hypothetical protein